MISLQVNPDKINFKTGGRITAFPGIFMMPWKLIADPQKVTFLRGLLGTHLSGGPLGGFYSLDYFLVRKQILKVEDLYKKDGVLLEFWWL